MRSLFLLAVSAATILAQVPAQNANGVGIGHVHLMTADPDAMTKIFVDVLGAKEGASGSLKMPGSNPRENSCFRISIAADFIERPTQGWAQTDRLNVSTNARTVKT